MKKYLASSKYINWHDPDVLAKARELANGASSTEEIARSCFEFVRDEIQHSGDFQRNPVTCKASDVLEHRTGYCYAKSHLLAALLRANQIPAALSYQRLTIKDDKPPFCLHGLNSIYLEPYAGSELMLEVTKKVSRQTSAQLMKNWHFQSARKAKLICLKFGVNRCHPYLVY